MWNHWALSALLYIELLILAALLFLSLQGESESVRKGCTVFTYGWRKEAAGLSPFCLLCGVRSSSPQLRVRLSPLLWILLSRAETW